MTLSRRDFLGVVGALAAAATLGAQEEPRNTTGTMDRQAYLPVRLPAKPGARPSMTAAQRDQLEHALHCQCGCGLDVFTCRTTDFTCSVSPAMHVDVMGLVAGGYDGREILAAFQRVYGERVLMAPVKRGFNWVGYLLPFVALGGGGAVVSTLVRRWSRPAVSATGGAVHPSAVDATPDELAQLDAAIRSGE